MSEVIRIGISRERALEGAIVFLSVLAYPRSDQKAKRADFFGACCAFLVREARKEGIFQKGVTAHSQWLRRYSVQRMTGVLNLGTRQIQRRLDASHLCDFSGTMEWTTVVGSKKRDPAAVQRDRFWISGSHKGPPPEEFRGGRRRQASGEWGWYVIEEEQTTEKNRPSVRDVVGAGARLMNMTERNFRRLVLEPGRPVLHMAGALRSTLLTKRHALDLTALLVNPSWVKQAVDISMLLRKAWRSMGKWPATRTFDPEQFIVLEADTNH